eukprot:scaffold82472_cov21-Phaeocystis_antarctica.AAC.1
MHGVGSGITGGSNICSSTFGGAVARPLSCHAILDTTPDGNANDLAGPWCQELRRNSIYPRHPQTSLADLREHLWGVAVPMPRHPLHPRNGYCTPHYV